MNAAQKESTELPPTNRRRPSFAVATLLYIPAAFFICSQLVRRASPEGYLTAEVGSAIRAFHLPASIVAVSLSLISLARYERHLWLPFLLFLAACAWLGMALGLTR